MAARLGLIEGYYGEPWSEVARAKAIDALAPLGVEITELPITPRRVLAALGRMGR